MTEIALFISRTRFMLNPWIHFVYFIPSTGCIPRIAKDVLQRTSRRCVAVPAPVRKQALGTQLGGKAAIVAAFACVTPWSEPVSRQIVSPVPV
jgi:hypothetical protein